MTRLSPAHGIVPGDTRRRNLAQTFLSCGRGHIAAPVSGSPGFWRYQRAV